MNNDLLDLCRLNIMEENIADSPAPDSAVAMKAIDWKRRQIAIKLKNKQPPIEKSVMEKHIRANTKDGVYPWTDTMIEEET